MQLDQALLVLLTSVGVSLLTEFISWFVVYRTSNYRRVKDELDRNAKKLEQYKQQGTAGAGSKKDSEKKVGLQGHPHSLNRISVRPMAAGGVACCWDLLPTISRDEISDPECILAASACTYLCFLALQEKKLEESVKNSAKDFQAVKMKANMVTGVVNLFVLNRLLATFEGVTGTHQLFQPSS
jgi:hypothetical protein